MFSLKKVTYHLLKISESCLCQKDGIKWIILLERFEYLASARKITYLVNHHGWRSNGKSKNSVEICPPHKIQAEVHTCYREKLAVARSVTERQGRSSHSSGCC